MNKTTRIETGDLDLLSEIHSSVMLVRDRLTAMKDKEVLTDDVNYINSEWTDLPDEIELLRLTVLDKYHGVPMMMVRFYNGEKCYMPDNILHGKTEFPMLGFDRAFMFIVSQISLRYTDYFVRMTKEAKDGSCLEKTIFNMDNTPLASVTVQSIRIAS